MRPGAGRFTHHGTACRRQVGGHGQEHTQHLAGPCTVTRPQGGVGMLTLAGLEAIELQTEPGPTSAEPFPLSHRAAHLEALRRSDILVKIGAGVTLITIK